MKRLIWSLLLLAAFFPACQRQVPVNDIENIPEVTEADAALADVYRSLDGSWSGEFEIFRDDSGAPRDEAALQNPNPSLLSRPNVNSTQVIKVRQQYESITPYFQEVSIQDTYPDGRVVHSQGVNKVQDGRMWCVVRKPEETVIHQGSTDGPETIIWQRDEQDPQKIEYFRETVSDDRYTIIGWGYYEGDDTSRMPRYWFYGIYRKDN